uniref:Uncharacterized protein n=1 Tax=Rhizophora mucronata TaxID=61149 RepID=A0A2P2NP86_RHIMU
MAVLHYGIGGSLGLFLLSGFMSVGFG